MLCPELPGTKYLPLRAGSPWDAAVHEGSQLGYDLSRQRKSFDKVLKDLLVVSREGASIRFTTEEAV